MPVPKVLTKRMGAWLSMCRYGTLNCGSNFIRIATSAASIFSKGSAPWRTYAKRLRTCNKCPIYLHNTKSCGIGSSPSLGGCGCYMPFKALEPTARCWAKENPAHPVAKEVEGWHE